MKRKLIAAMVMLLPAIAAMGQDAKIQTKPGERILLRSTNANWLGEEYGQNIQSIFFGGEVPNKSISLSVNDVTFEQALKTLCDTVSVKYAIDGDAPKDKKITVKVENVKFVTALNLICEAAGVHYGIEKKDGTTIIRAGKNVTPHVIWSTTNGNNFSSLLYRNHLSLPSKSLTITPNKLGSFQRGTTLSSPLLYQLSYGSEQSTFNCPHCKKQATVIRSKAAPKCPKCDRVFQGDWQFCPADGTKRPADSSAWKFCPMCGKGVDDKATSTVPVLRDIPDVNPLFTTRVTSNKVPILGDLPIIGNLFRTNNDVDR